MSIYFSIFGLYSILEHINPVKGRGRLIIQGVHKISLQLEKFIARKVNKISKA